MGGPSELSPLTRIDRPPESQSYVPELTLAANSPPPLSCQVSTHAALGCAAVLYPLLLNHALSSPLPIVLLSTLKNGNLVANALVGVVVLGKAYSAVRLNTMHARTS